MNVGFALIPPVRKRAHLDDVAGAFVLSRQYLQVREFELRQMAPFLDRPHSLQVLQACKSQSPGMPVIGRRQRWEFLSASWRTSSQILWNSSVFRGMKRSSSRAKRRAIAFTFVPPISVFLPQRLSII